MTDAAGKGLFPGAAITQNLSAWCQFCLDLTARDDECLLRHGWCAALRRTRKATHDHTSGNHRPLPPFSGHRQAASWGRTEASQQDGDQGSGDCRAIGGQAAMASSEAGSTIWNSCPKLDPNLPLKPAQRTWSRRSAPRRDHRICCDLFMRRLTRKLAVPSVSDVPTRKPARWRSA